MEKDIESKFNYCMFREYCRSLKVKLQAAEEMAKALKNTRLSLSICLMPRLDLNVAGNESIIEITIAGLSAALLLWEKAGKGDDEAQNKTL